MNSRTSIATPLYEVDNFLEEYFAQKTRDASHLGPWFEQLWQFAASTAVGGKCLRPNLLVAAHRALLPAGRTKSGSTPSSTNVAVVQAAAATELLHYSFLLHDDVIDEDTMRRGKPNLIALLTQTPPLQHVASADVGAPQRKIHWARSSAILMGNLLLSDAHQIFAALEIAEAKRKLILQLLSHTITESVAGEQLDVGLGAGIIPAELSTILAMCTYKTATYTFEFPLRTAATLAGSDARMDPILTQAGHLLGLAFQLQDDFLSVFGKPTNHGKDPFSDLREGKETAIIAYARMTSHWPAIEQLFGKPELSIADGQAIKERLVMCGAKTFTEALIGDQIRALHELLSEHRALIPDQLTHLLLDLASDLEGRSV